jgi:aspartyl aminopeptidase
MTIKLVALVSLLALTTLRAQDVGFANAWPELDPQGREHVMHYSEDFKAAQDPLFPQPQNPTLTSRLGYGMVIKEYGAGREANSEFFAKLRSLLDKERVRWQTHGYDAGYGGGTIASWFAGQNMDVIDVGIGLLRMHSPFEVSSKVDLWHLHRGFVAFFNS